MPHRLPASGRLELRPLVHVAVASAVEAGLREICVVCSPQDLDALRAYFEGAPDPRAVDKGTPAGAARAEAAREIAALAQHVTFIPQEVPDGYGGAVFRAREWARRRRR